MFPEYNLHNGDFPVNHRLYTQSILVSNLKREAKEAIIYYVTRGLF